MPTFLTGCDSPKTGSEAGVPADASTATCDAGPPPPDPEYHLHVDADRDGAVDDDRTGIDTWVWGAGKKGAIMLCNNDDDQGASASDNTDSKVNGGNDNTELAPIAIRRIGPAPPSNWEGFLEVASSDAKFIRVFDSRSAGAAEILGKSKGNTFKLPDLNFTEREFGIEATQYADGTFAGEITLIFTLKKGGVAAPSEQARIRVAPWMQPNHLDAATKGFVVDAGASNSRFRTELSALVAGAGCSLQSHSAMDIWMQDCMEIGYSNLPLSGIHAVMRNPRNRPLKTFAKTLRTADFGYHEQGTLGDITFDSTGNLECTPPATSKAGKRYPWGRIYYGPGRGIGTEEMNADVKAFLAKQVVQAPIEIDTSWLLVGHVDEIISFVPAPGAKGFKLLIASPKLAFKILEDNKAAHGSAKMLTGRTFPDVSPNSAEVSIKDFLKTGIPSISSRLKASHLKPYNDAKQATLDTILAKLKTELGLDGPDIIEVPIIFVDLTMASLADALTAGMVNMLVMNKHCIFPKPFGPVVGGKDLFEEDLKKKLTALGLTPHPIDDWFEYHVALGEVHCGTNTLRTPTTAKWWEFTP